MTEENLKILALKIISGCFHGYPDNPLDVTPCSHDEGDDPPDWMLEGTMEVLRDAFKNP